MPDEEIWRGFFAPETALRRLGLGPACGDVAEFGCGYGTFTIPAARGTAGTVHAFDIDAAMVETTRRRAAEAGLENVRVELRDFMARGTGLPEGACGYAMVFNILHPEDPSVLLEEARRVLRPGGTLAIMHWNHDASTPRGPDLSFRPRPADCRRRAEAAGFVAQGGVIDLPPYHWGLVLRVV